MYDMEGKYNNKNDEKKTGSWINLIKQNYSRFRV